MRVPGGAGWKTCSCWSWPMAAYRHTTISCCTSDLLELTCSALHHHTSDNRDSNVLPTTEMVPKYLWGPNIASGCHFLAVTRNTTCYLCRAMISIVLLSIQGMLSVK